MTGPPAATAVCRVAVRRSLADHDGAVLAAVSGGADSLALAAALAFERPGSGALVVDHALQPGSADVADRAAEQCRSLGLTARVLSAAVLSALPSPSAECGGSFPRIDPRAGNEGPHSGGGAGGPEAAARELRYRLLEEAAALLDAGDGRGGGHGRGGGDMRGGGHGRGGGDGRGGGHGRGGADTVRGQRVVPAGQAVVLLGHTRDDQAETVLLGLVRGSGARALAGMAPVRGRYRRPFLDVPRETVRQACAEAGLTPWEDPHNDDPAYTRVAVRTLLADLDIADGLSRSAALLRDDADALDALTTPTDDVAALAAMPAALRSRALKRWAEEKSGRGLTGVQVAGLRALVEQWHGQGPVALPGGGQVARVGGRLAFTP